MAVLQQPRSQKGHYITKRPSSHIRECYAACIGLDGTIKTKQFDDFYRDWPNIIIADDATIKSVDEKWNSLGLGPLYFITFAEI